MPSKKTATSSSQWMVYLLLLLFAATASTTLYLVLHPGLVLLHKTKAALLLGDTARASKAALGTIASKNVRPETLNQLGQEFLDIKDGKTAYELFAAALSNPTYNNAERRLALVRGMGDYGFPGLGLKLLHKFKSTSPPEAELLLEAEYLRRTRQPRAALAIYERLLRKTPHDPDILFGYAETLSWVGDHEKALPVARRLVETDPDGKATRLLYARLLNWAGKKEEAVKQYRILLGDTP